MSKFDKKTYYLSFFHLGFWGLFFFLAQGDMNILEGHVVHQEKLPPQCETGLMGVVGLKLRIRPRSYPRILEVYNHTPAYRAGLKEGDTVILIDGESTFNRPVQSIDRMIPDIPDRTFSLSITRSGVRSRKFLTVVPINSLPPKTRNDYHKSGFQPVHAEGCL